MSFEHTLAIKIKESEGLRIVYRCIECESVKQSSGDDIVDSISTTYSIMITLYNGDSLDSEAFIHSVSDDNNIALKIFDILVENTVTTTELDTVLDSVFDTVF